MEINLASTCIRHMFSNLNCVIFNFGHFVVLETGFFSVSNFLSTTRNSPASFPFRNLHSCSSCLLLSWHKWCSSSTHCFKSSLPHLVSSPRLPRDPLSLSLLLTNAAHLDLISFFPLLTGQIDNPQSIFNSLAWETRSDSFAIVVSARFLTISILEQSSKQHFSLLISLSASFII